MYKSIGLDRITDPHVKSYLEKNHAGQQIYVRKTQYCPAIRKTKKDAVEILHKNGFNEAEICKHLKVFPSQLKKIMPPAQS